MGSTQAGTAARKALKGAGVSEATARKKAQAKRASAKRKALRAGKGRLAAKEQKAKRAVESGLAEGAAEEGKSARGKRETVRNAARRTVKENGVDIAMSLLKGTEKGNASCARLLLELAEQGEAKSAGTKRKYFSLAEKLAAEPPWNGSTVESLKAVAEAEAGEAKAG